jgi:hypothetical protein
MLHHEQLYDTIADVAGPPEGGKAEGWIYGVILALPLAAYGVYCMFTQHAWFFALRIKGIPPNKIFHLYTGPLAIALGLIWFAVAMYLHFHYFWSQSPRLFRYYEIGRFVAIMLFIAAIGWWIYEFAQKFF